MHGGQRAGGLGGLLLAVRIESSRVRGLQVLDRLVRLAEHEIEAAEIVQQTGEVPLVVQLLVEALRSLGVASREHPVAHALGDERGLDVDVGHRRAVVERLSELERALDVLARCLEVALAPVAARAVGEDVRAQEVAGELRLLGDRIRLVEEADRGGDAGKLVAADAEPVEDLGPIEIGERLALDSPFSRARAAREPLAARPGACAPRPRRRAAVPPARRRRLPRPPAGPARTRTRPPRTGVPRRAPRRGSMSPRRDRARPWRRRSPDNPRRRRADSPAS